MADIQTLQSSRDQWFTLYDKGFVHKHQVVNKFLFLVFDASDDDAALQLCADGPLWFAIAFQAELRRMATYDYYVNYIPDRRPSEVIHQEALWRQKRLRWLASRVLQTYRSVRLTKHRAKKPRQPSDGAPPRNQLLG